MSVKRNPVQSGLTCIELCSYIDYRKRWMAAVTQSKGTNQTPAKLICDLPLWNKSFLMSDEINSEHIYCDIHMLILIQINIKINITVAALDMLTAIDMLFNESWFVTWRIASQLVIYNMPCSSSNGFVSLGRMVPTIYCSVVESYEMHWMIS